MYRGCRAETGGDMIGTERLQEWVTQLESEGLACLDDFLADEFFGHVPGADEPTARDQILPIAGALDAAMSDLTVAVSDIEPDADVIRAVLAMEGTHDGPLWGAPASGNEFSWSTPITLRPVGDRFAIRFDDVEFPILAGLLRGLEIMPPPDRMDRPMPHPVSFPDFLLKVIFTGQAGDKECTHLEQIAVVEPSTRVCGQCVAEGTIWPALRMCLICGFVGCCDTSTNKHAMAHHEETGHPIFRSIRMDEGWVWCYDDSAMFESRILDRHR
jgi:hypothetical protein